MGILTDYSYGIIQDGIGWGRAEPKQNADLLSIRGEMVCDLRNDDETADSGRAEKPLFKIPMRESMLRSVRSTYADKIGALKRQVTI